MSKQSFSDDELRAAFSAYLEDAPQGEGPDAELLWQAVSGHAPPEARRAAVDALATSPDAMLYWQLAEALMAPEDRAPMATVASEEGLMPHPSKAAADSVEGPTPAPSKAAADSVEGPTPAPLKAVDDRVASSVIPSRWTAWLQGWSWPLAAGLAIAASAAVFLNIGGDPTDPATTIPVDRQPADVRIQSALAPDAALPRDAFVLRWTTDFEATRYHIVVVTEELKLVASARDLTTPTFQVPPSDLSELPAQSSLSWRVTAEGPDGERIEAPRSFVTRIAD